MLPNHKSLWHLSGEALAMCYRGATGYEARLTNDASLVLSGEPIADFNYAVIHADKEAENRLRQFTAVAKSRKIPMLVLFSPEVASRLKPAAQQLGLQFAEHFPWMTYQAQNPTLEKSIFQIVRVETEEDLKASNRVIASAVNINVESVNRAFGPKVLEGSGMDIFVAKQDGKVVSTVQTTRAGSTVGIWAMATAPDQQRKGAAKALLNNMIAYHCHRGADLFYLGATPAGKPLYEKVGFKTVTVAEVWLLQ